MKTPDLNDYPQRRQELELLVVRSDPETIDLIVEAILYITGMGTPQGPAQ